MVQAYIIIWFLHKFLHKQSKAKWGVVLAVGIAFNILAPYIGNILPEIIAKLFEQSFFPYIWIFIFGAFICEYFERWKDYLKKYWWIFLIMATVVTFTGIDLGTYGTFKVLFLAPAIIGFAYKYPGLNIKKDISYGFYIYHMIVINLMIELGLVGRGAFILLAFIVSVVLAIISYHTTGALYRKTSCH